MKAYLKNLVALLVSIFGAHASVDNQAMGQDSAEEEVWTAALDRGTLEAFEEYLAAYPIGVHSREAFARIVQLSPEPQIFEDLEEVQGSTVEVPPPIVTPSSPTILDRRLGNY